MAALIIAIFPQNSSRGNWEEQQDRTDPNSRFELARKPAWLLAFRQFGLPKWKHDFESGPLWPLRYRSLYAQPLFFLAFFRWKRALERTDGKNSKLIQFSNRVKPARLQGFWWTKRTDPRKISSAAPSTTRTTLHMLSLKFWKNTEDRTTGQNSKIFTFLNWDKPASRLDFRVDKTNSLVDHFECAPLWPLRYFSSIKSVFSIAYECGTGKGMFGNEGI